MPSAPTATAGGLGPLDLRVGFVGKRGLQWLGGWVDPVSLGDDGASPALAAPADLDALVLDPDPPGVARAEVERLAREARAAGTPVIGVADPDGGRPLWRGLADLAVGSDPSGGGERLVDAPPPVDPRLVNPFRFSYADVAGLAAVLTGPAAARGLREALPLLAEAAAEEPVTLFTTRQAELPELPPGVASAVSRPAALAGRVGLLHRHLGVLDHPALHANDWSRAGWLVRLCAAGVPVAAAELSAEVRRLLGPELAAALEPIAWPDVLDLDARERISVSLRRAALRHHSLAARWRSVASATGLRVASPTVTVVFSTRRESWLAHGLEQIAKQTYEPIELVVALHGDDFSPGVEGRVEQQVGRPVSVIHVDSELTLGDALNQGVATSSGALVTKMDDDDFYSPEHLWDLVLAVEYSGADLVGKAAEFVYLEEIDVTIRQLSKDTETRLAGGGMMMRRESLLKVGGWPSMSRAEDLTLVRTFVKSGLKVHRIPPHGYILNRHGRDHTWRPHVDYFLFRSGWQWRGLRFEETGVA